MGQSKEYKEKYEIAKKMYLSGLSLSFISKELHMDRGALSNNLKFDNIEIINKLNITKFNENYFDIIDTEDKAYWLGFLYADGSVSSDPKRNVIELSLKSSDINHLIKFKKSLSYEDNKHIYQDDIRCRIECSNKHLKESLIKLGCTPRKSFILQFPNENLVPNNLIFDFLRGYVDGDGSIMIGKNHKGIYDKPRINILGTENFLESIIKKTNWKKVSILHIKNIYSIEWNGYYVLNYLDLLYLNANIYLDRKYEKYLELKRLNNCRL